MAKDGREPTQDQPWHRSWKISVHVGSAVDSGRHFSETRALVEHQHFRIAVHGPERACTSPRTRRTHEKTRGRLLKRRARLPSRHDRTGNSESAICGEPSGRRGSWTARHPAPCNSGAMCRVSGDRARRLTPKRFVSEYAESAIGDSTKYLIARLFDEDPSFRPCACTGLVPRLRHASVAPFRARKSDGRTVFSFARIAGVTASNVAASTWYPAPRGVSGVARHIAIDFAGKVGVDLLREFLIHRRRGC